MFCSKTLPYSSAYLSLFFPSFSSQEYLPQLCAQVTAWAVHIFTATSCNENRYILHFVQRLTATEWSLSWRPCSRTCSVVSRSMSCPPCSRTCSEVSRSMARPLCTRRGLAHSWAGCCPTSCAWMPPCTCSWSWPRCTRVCSMMSRPMSTTPKNAKRKWKQWCLASWSPTRSWLRCTRVCSVVSRPMTVTRITVSAPKESEWELTGQCWRNVTPVMKAWPTSCCMIFGMIKWCCTIDLPHQAKGGPD